MPEKTPDSVEKDSGTRRGHDTERGHETRTVGEEKVEKVGRGSKVYNR